MAGTTDIAHGWSCRLASTRVLGHNYGLGSALATHGSANWTTYGENVGMESKTAGADALFRAYMRSPGHRANILDPAFKYIGIWTHGGGGFHWNTLDFVGRYASSYSYSYGPTRRFC